MLGHHCCVVFSLVASSRGCSLLAVQELLSGGCSCCRVWALGAGASVAVACGFSCAEEYGIFPDQRSNPCLMHWQVNSIHWTTREVRKISLLIVMMNLTLRSQDAAEETKKSEVNGLEVEFGVRASPQFRSQLPDNLAKADPSPQHSVTQKSH